jgi:hypothetical protein
MLIGGSWTVRQVSISLFPSPSNHILFLLVKKKVPGYLLTPEWTTTTRRRSTSLILPLKKVKWEPYGIDVNVPADRFVVFSLFQLSTFSPISFLSVCFFPSHALSYAEFGPNYMTPYYSRADCFHNSLQLRFMY